MHSLLRDTGMAHREKVRAALSAAKKRSKEAGAPAGALEDQPQVPRSNSRSLSKSGALWAVQSSE